MLPLRFYGSTSDKLKNKEYMHEENENLQLCPKNTLIDFQIQRAPSPETITEFKVYSENDVLIQTLPTTLITITTVMTENNQMDILVYNHSELDVDLDCGVYYIKVSDGEMTRYSEDFRVVNYEANFETSALVGNISLTPIAVSETSNLVI